MTIIKKIMRSLQALYNLQSMILTREDSSSVNLSLTDTDYKSLDSILSSKKNSQTSELLITNGLAFHEIKERVELIEKSIKDGLMLDQESLKKFERIKQKIQICEELEEAKKTKKFLIKEVSLSEKYLSPFLLEHFSIKLKSKLDSDVETKIHGPRKSLRISDNHEEDMKKVASDTEIKNITEGDIVAFKLGFYSQGHDFQYQIKFKQNKCDFIFEIVFPCEISSAIKLFPEEIQLAMFDKLVKSFPKVLDKLKDVTKINLTQSEIINEKSCSLISQYLHLKSLKDNSEKAQLAMASVDHKILLSSSPNQSNSDNFLNQLIAKYELDQKNIEPPKVICSSSGTSSLRLSARGPS